MVDHLTAGDSVGCQFCDEDDGWHSCYSTYDRAGLAVSRGCSQRNRICEDLPPGQQFPMYGFPVSRGCRRREKISVKTRDCENRLRGGVFMRKCFCRKLLCNVGYDDRQDIMRGEVRGVAALSPAPASRPALAVLLLCISLL